MTLLLFLSRPVDGMGGRSPPLFSVLVRLEDRFNGRDGRVD